MNKSLQQTYSRLLWLMVLLWAQTTAQGQTPVPLASQPGLSYTENFSDVVNWTNGFASGTGASRFGSVVVGGGSATIPNAVKTTTSSSSFTSGTSGGVQKGTENIVLLSTGSGDNTSSVAIDFFVDFTGVKAGTLSFDAASVANSTGNRNGTLKVYASTNGTDFVDLGVNFTATNNVAASAPISVTLPASLDNSSTARFRFYYYNGSGGTTGSRPKIAIDNLTITGNAADSVSATLSANPNALTGLDATQGTVSAVKSYMLTGSNLEVTPVTISATDGVELSADGNTFTPTLSLTPSSGSLTQTVYARLASTVNAGSFNGTITNTSNSTLTASVTVNGQVNPVNNPTLTANPTTLGGFSTTQNAPSASQIFSLTGSDLSSPITVSAPMGFEVSTSSDVSTFAPTATLPADGGTVYVRLSGTNPGSISGTVTNVSGAVSASVTVTGTVTGATSTPGNVVISQVYGGGGNTGATYKNDFIELYNRTSESVNLANWSVQYAGATGASWQVTPLSGTIPAGGYYLIQEGAGAGGTTDLPKPDAQGSINMGGMAGKVVLVNTTAALSGTCPIGASVIDFVGFGTTANCFEGTGPTPAPNNTTAVLRKAKGTTDTNDNSTDFVTGSPEPRNSIPLVPTITAAPEALTGTNGLSYVAGNGPASKTLTVNAKSLNVASGDIVITSSDNTITVSPLTIPFSSSALASATVTVQLAAGLSAGVYSSTITLAGGGATLNVPVSATVSSADTPTLTASATVLNNFSTTQGTVSSEQTFTVTTTNLTNEVLVSAPAGVEVSQTSGSGFSSSLTLPSSTSSATIYARLTGASAGQVNGTITATSGNLTANVTVSGVVNSSNGYTPISIARTGVGQTFTIAGRVTVTNQLGARQIYIQDNTGGLVVYSGASGTDLTTQVQLGDSVQVRGPVTVFNGFVELTNTQGFTVVSGVPNRVPTPKAITLDQLANCQGQLVSIADATLSPVNTTFVGNSNYTITASGQSGVLRINSNSPLAGAGQPANPVSVTGIADRFVSGVTTVGTDGLQLQPRILADIPGSTAAQDQICTIASNTTLTRDQTLDIAAWNMEFFGADAGTIICPTGPYGNLNYNDMGPVNEDLQQSNAVTVLGKLNVDIISVEEISDINRFDAAVKSLPGSYSYVCSNRFSYYFQDDCAQRPSGNPPTVFGPSSLAQKVCVIYNTQTVTPVLAETKPLLDGKYNYPSDNGWSSGRLPFLFVADATINGVTRRVHVVAIHAKSGSATADYTRRKQDIIDLKANLDADYPNANIIILGDYNDKLNGSIASGQQSSYKPFVDDASNYSALTLPLENAGCSTFNSSASFIDHMIVSNELAAGYVANSVYVLQPFSIPNYGNTTSDHNPIVSRFDLSQLAGQVSSLTLVASANPTTLEATGTTTITATATGGTAPYSYTFSGPGTITPNNNTATVSGLTAGVQTFTVIARDVTTPTSQTVSATVSVTVNAPSITATLAGSATVCAGTSTTLNVAIAGGTAPYKVVYSDGSTTTTVSDYASGAPILVTPSSTTTYTLVSVTDGSNYTAANPSGSAVVTVNTSPTLTSFVASGTLTCAQPSVTLTATATGADLTYAFVGPGLNVMSSSNQATVSQPGTYSVTVTNGTSCPAVSGTVSVSNNVDAPAAPSLLTSSSFPYPSGVSSLTVSQNTGEIVLTVSGCSGGTINWPGGSASTYAVSTANTGVFSYQATCTRNGCTSPVATATVTVVPTKLSVLHRDADFGNITNNIIKPYLQLSNAGNNPIPYSEVTIRYWLTSEGNALPTDLAVYFAQLGTGKVKMKYVALPQPRQGALGYIEYSFDGSAGNLAAGSTSGPIENGIQKTDRSTFNEGDDYSYSSVTSYTPNSRITAYRNGVIFWGVEPTVIPVQTALKVYSAAKDSPTTSSITTRIEVRNEGNVAVPASAIKVRYWFTSDNGQPANVYVDYAAVGAQNVQRQVVKLSSPVRGADSYAELSFTANVPNLAPLSSLGFIDLRLVRSDFGLLDQTNDYSYKAVAPLAENTHITVYLNGTLVYGTEPSGAPARVGAAEEPTSSLQVHVLGNPVVGSAVDVDIRGVKGQSVQINLVDLKGRILHQQTLPQAGEQDRVSVPVSSGQGQLLLQVSVPGQRQQFKLLKP